MAAILSWPQYVKTETLLRIIHSLECKSDMKDLRNNKHDPLLVKNFREEKHLWTNVKPLFNIDCTQDGNLNIILYFG